MSSFSNNHNDNNHMLRRNLLSKSSSFSKENLSNLWSGRKPSKTNPVAVITLYAIFLTGLGIGSTYSYLYRHNNNNHSD